MRWLRTAALPSISPHVEQRHFGDCSDDRSSFPVCLTTAERSRPSFTELVILVAIASFLMLATCAIVPLRVGLISTGFAWTLLALGWVDFKTGRLPDLLTLPLCLAGLVANWETIGIASDHFIGAAAGFAGATLVARIYRYFRAREGLGGGDVKLLAAIGAWVGWQGLPTALFLSCVAALVFTVLRRRSGLNQSLRFGPFLAAGAWLVWTWQNGLGHPL